MSLMLQGANLTQPGDELKQASRALESLLLKQMLASSQAFRGSESPGAAIHADLFVEALADAVVQAGGLGLAEKIQSSVSPTPSPSNLPSPLPALSPPPPTEPKVAGMTSGFGMRHDPFTGELKAHKGIDLSGQTGDAILAAQPGTVVFAGNKPGYGNVVEIEHEGGIRTLYAHASAIHVKKGDMVTQGQEIGEVGQTGRATGPHLHFEVKVQGKAVDPVRALKAYGVRAEELSREIP